MDIFYLTDINRNELRNFNGGDLSTWAVFGVAVGALAGFFLVGGSIYACLCYALLMLMPAAAEVAEVIVVSVVGVAITAGG